MTNFDSFVMTKTHEIVSNAVNKSLKAYEQSIIAKKNNDNESLIKSSKIMIKATNTVMCAAKSVTDFAFINIDPNVSESEYSKTLNKAHIMVEPYIKITADCVKDICEIRDDF
jgi:hypothetical protein